MLLLSVQSAEGVNQFEPPSSSSKAPNLSLYSPLSTLPDNLEVFRVWMMKLGKPGVLILSQNCSESIRELDDGKICRNHIFLVKKTLFSQMLARKPIHGRFTPCAWHASGCTDADILTAVPRIRRRHHEARFYRADQKRRVGAACWKPTRWLKWCLMMMMMIVPWDFLGFWSLLEYVARIAPLETLFSSQLAGVVGPQLHPGSPGAKCTSGTGSAATFTSGFSQFLALAMAKATSNPNCTSKPSPFQCTWSMVFVGPQVPSCSEVQRRLPRSQAWSVGAAILLPSANQTDPLYVDV